MTLLGDVVTGAVDAVDHLSKSSAFPVRWCATCAPAGATFAKPL